NRPLARYLEVGVQLSERLEHEPPLVQARVRHLQERLVDGRVAVEQEVEVERARALRRRLAAVSPKGALQLEHGAEKRPGRQLGLELDGSVEETRLVEIVERLGVAEARDAFDLDLGEATASAGGCPSRL